jgi:hypothetical protein
MDDFSGNGELQEMYQEIRLKFDTKAIIFCVIFCVTFDHL